MKVLKNFFKIFLVFLPFFSLAQEKILIFPSPIFSEVNFYPGKEMASRVLIQNGTQNIYQKIILKGEKVLGENNLSQAFTLKVENLDSINLNEFLNGKNLILEEKILPGEIKNLNFVLSFKENGEGDNVYQGKKLAFNFIFEFIGEEIKREKVSGVEENFQILKESIFENAVGEDFAEISWQTNFPGTSQIIYAKEGEKHILDLNDNQGNPPKYGYQRTTLEYDLDPKVTFHKVKISQLEPGTTYFYRCVSRGSFFISEERSFKTKKKETKITQEIKQAKKPQGKNEGKVEFPQEISLPSTKERKVKPEVLGKTYFSFLSLGKISLFILSFIFGILFAYFLFKKTFFKKRNF